MKLSDSFGMGIGSLVANKFRSFLTMLGVVIGIFAVVTLVSMGEAGKAYIHFQVAQFGTGSTYMEVSTGKKGDEGAGRLMAFLDSKLTLGDARAIQDKAKHVKEIIAMILRSAKIKYGHKTYETNFVMGTNYNVVNVYVSYKVTQGRIFNKQEEALRKKVIVIGPAVAKKLFGSFPAIGEKVKIKSTQFTIIGILEEKGSMFGTDYDAMCMIPITAAEDVFDTHQIMQFGVIARDERSVPTAQKEIFNILLDRHGEEDFRIDTQEEMLDIMNNIMSALTSLIGGIAAISLLVGGIGIMNIMLVSVTERTKEIGLRKAVGATNRDILSQFLVESVLISAIGGAIGIIIGVIVSLLIMRIIHLPLTIATWAAIVAFFVAIIVGIASGLYPSMRAASLDPIEALRYE